MRWDRLRLVGVLLILTSCSLFEYHPYEIRLEDSERNLNRKAFASIQATSPGDTVSFILIGDTQRFYDETEKFVSSANQQDVDFVVLAGDISDFGIDKEFQWVNEILSDLNKPYVGVIGNHDVSGAGESIFKEMYGPVNDSFIYGGIKFILINTNSREYRFNGVVPDVGWLQEELAGDDFDRAIVIGHVPPFDGDFDPELETAYAQALKSSGKVNLSLYAHQHTFKDLEPYEDGIRYVVASSMADLFYVKINVWGDSVSVEKVSYE